MCSFSSLRVLSLSLSLPMGTWRVSSVSNMQSQARWLGACLGHRDILRNPIQESQRVSVLKGTQERTDSNEKRPDWGCRWWTARWGLTSFRDKARFQLDSWNFWFSTLMTTTYRFGENKRNYLCKNSAIFLTLLGWPELRIAALTC